MSHIDIHALGSMIMIIGAFLTFGTAFVLGWTMPGHRPLHDYVSELTLGPLGWVQRVNFLFTGAVQIIFGLGISQGVGPALSVRAGGVLVALIGLGLIGCGVTPVERRPFSMMSQGARLHLLCAIVFVFAPMPLACLAFASAFDGDPGRSWLVPYTLATGAMSVVFFLMGMSPGLATRLSASRWLLVARRYAGLIQRLGFGVFLIWEVVVSLTASRPLI
jgi:hypothetical protein